jgi:DNA-binding MarR family transcriptional regulator
LEDQKIDEVAEGFLKIFPVVIKYFIQLGDKLSDPTYSYQEYQALHILKECGKLPISTVGAMLLISKPRMTVLVDKLTRAGFIKRVPNKEDRRIIKISLTEKGVAFTAAHRQNLKEGVIERFENLSSDEMDDFLSAMNTVQDVMAKTKSTEEYW